MGALWIVAGAFTAAGMPFVLIARSVFARDRRIRQWPRAPGVIVESGLETTTQTVRDQDHWGGIEYKRFRPRIHYTYEVAGQTLHGGNIGRELAWMDEKPARKYLARYPAQQAVQVLYDPNDARTAYLEIERSIGATILAVWGGVFIFVGALLAFLAIIL